MPISEKAIYFLDENARRAGIKRLKEMVKSEPCLLDGYAHLGLYLSETSLAQSDKWYIEGVEKGKSLIPEGFSGSIPWGFLDNRPFLRCHHGYILSLLRKSKYELAIAEMELHLQWNPNDNKSMRMFTLTTTKQEQKPVPASESGCAFTTRFAPTAV